MNIDFFKEYVQTMKLLCQASDILFLQGEDNAHIGIPLPSVTTCIKKLDSLLKEANQSICLPLASATKNGLLNWSRNSLNDLEFVLASSFHPHFKLK